MFAHSISVCPWSKTDRGGENSLGATKEFLQRNRDLTRRVPELQKAELVTLSEIGALNPLGKELHRRSALWQVERAARPGGSLLDTIPEQLEFSPLKQMTDEEAWSRTFTARV